MPPAPTVHVSENSELLVRVEPGSASSSGSPAKAAHCKFFRYCKDKKVYEFWREHDLVNMTRPCDVIIPDDGSFLLTFDDWFGIGTSENTVVVYDASGRVTKKWALSDILSEAEIEKLSHSTASIHWRGEVGLMIGSQHEVWIEAPEPSARNGYRPCKGFLLDTNFLTIRERPASQTSQPPAGAITGRWPFFRSSHPFWPMLAIGEGVILIGFAIGFAFRSLCNKPAHEQP